MSPLKVEKEVQQVVVSHLTNSELEAETMEVKFSLDQMRVDLLDEEEKPWFSL